MSGFLPQYYYSFSFLNVSWNEITIIYSYRVWAVLYLLRLGVYKEYFRNYVWNMLIYQLSVYWCALSTDRSVIHLTFLIICFSMDLDVHFIFWFISQHYIIYFLDQIVLFLSTECILTAGFCIYHSHLAGGMFHVHLWKERTLNSLSILKSLIRRQI